MTPEQLQQLDARYCKIGEYCGVLSVNARNSLFLFGMLALAGCLVWAFWYSGRDK